MKLTSVSTKLNIAIIAVSSASLIIAFFVLFWYAQEITDEVYLNTKADLIESAQNRLESKMRVGITNAISIANDQRIKRALATNKREDAIESLKDISLNMEKYTDFKNIKIHLHTKNNHSFLRNWKLDKYGDDLSSFRAAIVAVNKTLSPISAFEPGRAGLLLRAIVPILDESGNHFGSLEFIQGLNSVAKAFDKINIGYLVLMDVNVNESIKTGQDFSFNENDRFKDYLISQKFVNKDFLADAKTINMQKLFNDGFLLSEKYFYTYTDVQDFKDKKLGIILLAKPLSLVNATINKAATLIYIALLGIFIMMVIINFTVILAIKKLVTSPLSVFEHGLSDFFLYLQGKKSSVQGIKIKTRDEFGKMAHNLEENIAVSAKLHEEIRDLNTNLEAKVIEKTHEISILLDNAGQGFLAFNCNLAIDERYSKECTKLLGEDLSGKNIAEVLFTQENQKIFFENTMQEICKIDDDIVRKSLISLLPTDIILNKRALQLSYKMLENNYMMLILTNVTAQKKLEKKVKQEQDTLKMIVEIIGESDSFYDTKKEYETFIKTYKELIDPTKTSLYNISEVYRTIHTFKGSFSQLYMNSMVTFLHSIESELSNMIKKNEDTNETLIEFLDSMDFNTTYKDALDVIRTILGNEFLNSQNYVKINFKDIKNLQNKIRTIFERQNLNTQESRELLQQISNLSNQKLLNLLKPYANLTQQLAKKLGKEIYDLEIIGDDDIMVNDKYKPFIKSLTHIFRNSVDHGIEDPMQRAFQEKDEHGTITCSFSKHDDSIEIIISDDGAGIDKEKVLEKAINQQIVTKEKAETMSENEIYHLIFSEHFSTKEEVSEISGRGIGMNAVQIEIEKLSGHINITSQKGFGTTFVMNIPSIGEA